MSAKDGKPHHPILNPRKRQPSDGDYVREEVRLANRNSGTLLEGLRYDVTPVGMHYLLNHFDVPYVPDASGWLLEVAGLVREPLKLTLGDIRSAPQRTLRVTMECAGNGRAAMTPRWVSQPWFHEAVGTAEWTGAPLKPFLERAGLPAEARNVVFYGRDRGVEAGISHNFGRSLACERALGDDVLLVWGMNGAPLLPQHGFPLRLIVPGWYGMASVKWLERIEVIDRPFDGVQQVRTYTYRKNAEDPGVPVTTMRVKSLMVPPGIPDWYSRHRLLDAGRTTVVGRAWSGAGVSIARVELAIDGQWRDAVLDPEAGLYAWRGWRCDWDAAPGEHELMCRATDANGDVQPVDQRYDRGGFGNNAVQRVQVTVT